GTPMRIKHDRDFLLGHGGVICEDRHQHVAGVFELDVLEGGELGPGEDDVVAVDDQAVHLTRPSRTIVSLVPGCNHRLDRPTGGRQAAIRQKGSPGASYGEMCVSGGRICGATPPSAPTSIPRSASSRWQPWA